jgi:hypothetical protein
MYASEPNLNDELWKRSIWVLIIMDRTACLHLGHPCVIQDDDFDVDLPMAVDDEYWEEPVHLAELPVPPKNGPSTMDAFVCAIQLTRMLAFALRTVVSRIVSTLFGHSHPFLQYSVNKSQMLHGFLGPEWEQKVTVELSSALNRWYESIPDRCKFMRLAHLLRSS